MAQAGPADSSQPPPAPRPPLGSTAASPLPPHLQHAAHTALSSLQAQRLLYPQQCTAAEAAGGSARADAERRVLAQLGGAFDYTSAAAELEGARRAAKQLMRSQRGGGSGGARAAAATVPSEAPAPLATGQAQSEDLWSSFVAFSAALAADVDRRIAAARLLPPPAAAAPRLRSQRRAAPAAEAPNAAAPQAAAPAGLPSSSSRPPLARVQAPAAASPGAAERKRGRSPSALPAAAAAAAVAGGRSKARRPPSLPSSKRPRPHVAFGTRCGAPCPAPARGAKPVRLDAAAPPAQLPLVQPADASQPAPQAAAGVAAPRSDLLRSLAAAFAGGSGGGGSSSAPASGAQPVAAAEAAAGDGQSASAGGNSEQMQHMLAELTAALQGLSLPASTQPTAPASADCGGGVQDSGSGALQAALQQHGIDAAAAQSAGGLLQAVLDRLDAVAGPAAEAASGAVAASRPASPSQAAAAPAPGPLAEQLCAEFSRLLEASGAGLAGLQQQVEQVHRVQAAVQRLNAAAVEAALTSIEAAAHAAEAAPMQRRRSSSTPAAQEEQEERSTVQSASQDDASRPASPLHEMPTAPASPPPAAAAVEEAAGEPAPSWPPSFVVGVPQAAPALPQWLPPPPACSWGVPAAGQPIGPSPTAPAAPGSPAANPSIGWEEEEAGPFSVASSEQLLDSPASSSHGGSEAGGVSSCGQLEWPEEDAEEEQEAEPAEEADAEPQAEAAPAWSADGDPPPGGQEPAPAAASPQHEAAAAEAPPEQAAAQQQPEEHAAASAAPLQPPPAPWPPLVQQQQQQSNSAPAPYNPLQFAAQKAAAAAAARRAAASGGWRELQRRADELAAWQERAAQLVAEDWQEEQDAWEQPFLPWADSGAAAPAAAAWRWQQHPPRPAAERRLWRPSQLGQTQLSGVEPALASPLPPSPLVDQSRGSGGDSSTPASSSLPTTVSTSSSSGTGLGAAARHKARALRYRLLRRRLEAAAAGGLPLSPQASTPGCPSVTDSLCTPASSLLE